MAGGAYTSWCSVRKQTESDRYISYKGKNEITDDELQKLLDSQGCIELVYKLSRGIDRLDAELIGSVFHPTRPTTTACSRAVVTSTSSGPRGAWRRWIGRSTRSATSSIGVRGDEARGESYVIATHDRYDDGKMSFEKKDESAKPVTLTNGGRYLDSFRRRGS